MHKDFIQLTRCLDEIFRNINHRDEEMLIGKSVMMSHFEGVTITICLEGVIWKNFFHIILYQYF